MLPSRKMEVMQTGGGGGAKETRQMLRRDDVGFRQPGRRAGGRPEAETCGEREGRHLNRQAEAQARDRRPGHAHVRLRKARQPAPVNQRKRGKSTANVQAEPYHTTRFWGEGAEGIA